jgi:hypothetical protein
MLNKDEKYKFAKDAYGQMSAFDLDEAGLPHVFDLLTTQQKEFFINFFCASQGIQSGSEIEGEFLDFVENDLGIVGYDTIKSILRRGEFKIVK